MRRRANNPHCALGAQFASRRTFLAARDCHQIDRGYLPVSYLGSCLPSARIVLALLFKAHGLSGKSTRHDMKRKKALRDVPSVKSTSRHDTRLQSRSGPPIADASFSRLGQADAGPSYSRVFTKVLEGNNTRDGCSPAISIGVLGTNCSGSNAPRIFQNDTLIYNLSVG